MRGTTAAIQTSGGRTGTLFPPNRWHQEASPRPKETQHNTLRVQVFLGVSIRSRDKKTRSSHPSRYVLSGSYPFMDALQTQEESDEGNRGEKGTDHNHRGKTIVRYHRSISENSAIKNKPVQRGFGCGGPTKWFQYSGVQRIQVVRTPYATACTLCDSVGASYTGQGLHSENVGNE